MFKLKIEKETLRRAHYNIVSRNFVKNKWNLTYNYLLVWGNRLQGFLNDPATIHLQSQGQDVSTDTCCQSQLLVCTSKLTDTKQTLFSTDATEQESLFKQNRNDTKANFKLSQPQRTFGWRNFQTHQSSVGTLLAESLQTPSASQQEWLFQASAG